MQPALASERERMPAGSGVQQAFNRRWPDPRGIGPAPGLLRLPRIATATARMNSSAALLSLLTLIVPFAGEPPRDVVPIGEAETVRAASAAPEGKIGATGFRPETPAPLRAIEEALRTPLERQVRIEQRVIIRIAPGAPPAREGLVADLARNPAPQRYEERPVNGCVPVNAIAGVQPGRPDRLLLFMRDRRVMTAALERTCSAADFYSGFYVERNADGALCPRRDQLHSRAGASCRIAQFNRLVAASD
jgi:hypothetical protein